MAVDKKKKKPKPLLKTADKRPVVAYSPREYGSDYPKRLDKWLENLERERRRERR